MYSVDYVQIGQSESGSVHIAWMQHESHLNGPYTVFAFLKTCGGSHLAATWYCVVYAMYCVDTIVVVCHLLCSLCLGQRICQRELHTDGGSLRRPCPEDA